MKNSPGDAAPWTDLILPGTSPALLDWDCLLSVWDSTPLFQTGWPPLHFSRGARLAPGSFLGSGSLWLIGDFRGCWSYIRLLSCSY